MLERLAGNDALKRELGTALHSGRLPHAVLLVGGAGLRCGLCRALPCGRLPLPGGRPHAEAVLKGRIPSVWPCRGEGASGQIPRQKGPRGPRGDPALGAVHRCGGPCAVHLRCAEPERNAGLVCQCAAQDHWRSRPRGVLFFVDGTQRSGGAADHSQPVCAAYTIAPVPVADCAAHLRAERLPAAAAGELAFLYEGHIGTALKSWNDPPTKAALGMAKTLCGYAAQGGYLPGTGAADKVRARQGRALPRCCGSWTSCAVRCCAALPTGRSSAAA